MQTIIVSVRSNDIHACLEGKPEIWGCGKNSEEAIKDLINHHPEYFSTDIPYQVKKN